MTDRTWIVDFDNHYYEATDAFTRHLDPKLRSRGVQWVTVNGRERLLVGGQLNSYILNPTFDPVAKPGALYSTGTTATPEQTTLKDAFGELEPIRPEYRDRDARLAVMDEQGLGGTLLFPTLGVGIEDAIKHDKGATVAVFEAFNRWLEDDWGYNYKSRIFAVPYIQLLDPHAAAVELQRVLDLGAVAINIRNAPVPVPGGYRSPFEPDYDAFWGLVDESRRRRRHPRRPRRLRRRRPDVGVRAPRARCSAVPLRGVISKGRAVSDFYAAAVCQLLFERFDDSAWPASRTVRRGSPDLLHRLATPPTGTPGTSARHPTETSASACG